LCFLRRSHGAVEEIDGNPFRNDRGIVFSSLENAFVKHRC
jgi:hypothetical protein